MARPRKFTAKQVERLKADRADGWTLAELADQYGTSTSIIRFATDESAREHWNAYMRAYRSKQSRKR